MINKDDLIIPTEGNRKECEYMINKDDLIKSVKLIKAFCDINECRNCPLLDVLCSRNVCPFEWNDNILENEIKFYDKANYNDD